MGAGSANPARTVVEIDQRDARRDIAGRLTTLTGEQRAKLEQIAKGNDVEVDQLINFAVSALLGYVDSHRGSLHLPLDYTHRWSPRGWSPVESGYANPQKLAQIASTVNGTIDALVEVGGYLQYLSLRVTPQVFEGACAFFDGHQGYGADLYRSFATYLRKEAAEARKNP